MWILSPADAAPTHYNVFPQLAKFWNLLIHVAFRPPLHYSILSLLWRHNWRDSVSITSLTFVYSTVYSDADQRKHLSAASLAFVRGFHTYLYFVFQIYILYKAYIGIIHHLGLHWDFTRTYTLRCLHSSIYQFKAAFKALQHSCILPSPGISTPMHHGQVWCIVGF